MTLIESQWTPAESPRRGAWTWEEAVQWLREQPDQHELVRACYYDDPLPLAARRFAESEEWRAVREVLPAGRGRALDLGAGRGISSFALAEDGWHVTAVEPDASELIGAGAIRSLVEATGASIDVVERIAESLPFAEAEFDLVYGRQVLHHAESLRRLCAEAARVLRPGGTFLATREHVISRRRDLATFLASHPLHRFYGGENAYLLREYLEALRGAGLIVRRVWGPFDSVINYFPMSQDEWQRRSRRPLASVTGERIARALANPQHSTGRWLLRRLAARWSRRCDTPGRLYSFLAEKPN